MTQSMTHTTDLYVALIHHPVLNKKGDLICSAITNLDLHDIARASRTFGVRGYYVINPLDDQKILAEKIVEHWRKGDGGVVNPARREAFELIRITDSLGETVADIERETGKTVRMIATTARTGEKSVSYGSMRDELLQGGCFLLLFGTAWGLPDDILDQAEWTLEPVKGPGDYNHLSVRSAVSIILDRLVTGRP
jgi:hypothetical protein